MENEEQTTQEPSPVIPGSSSTRMAVMGILLIAMVAMALIQSSAKRGRDNAVAKADEMEGFATPAEYVKAIGKTPRIDIKDRGVTQVYRWKGVLQHFELRVNFLGSDGVSQLQERNPPPSQSLKVGRTTSLNLRPKQELNLKNSRK